MSNTTLEQVIRNHVSLSSRTNSHGWYQVLCKVCNDHGRKGKRAGFHFEGDTVGYNCFNCGHAAVYDPAVEASISNKMRTVLESFGVPQSDWQEVVFHNLASGQTGSVKQKLEQYEPSTITLPPYFTPINENGDDVDLYAIQYLTDERQVDWKSYPFFIGRKNRDPLSRRWFARLIIPIYKDGKLIYYQGRDLTGIRQKKYISADIPKENVLYGYENILKRNNEPLYIVEGWFDAWKLNGVAVMGNKMTPHQIHWINQTDRPKVVIPDRFGDGYLLAEQGLKHGWSISVPDIGECKDPSEAMKKYGEMYTLLSIRNNTFSDFEASVRLKFFCENQKHGT